jgi:prophage regulatory protein
MAQENSSTKVLRLKQVQEKIGLSRSTIYERINPNSSRYDPSFPKPIKLNKHAVSSIGAVGWLEAELDKWLINCAIS